MRDLETIDSTALEAVSGGALPIKPIIKGVEKGAELVKDGYQAIKPYAKKAYDWLGIGTTIGTAGELAHEGWNYVFGHKQPAPQPKGGHQ